MSQLNQDEHKLEQAEKLFRAFSGIDEELLARSEKKKSNILTFRAMGTVAAACVGLLLFGSVAVVYTTGGINKNTADYTADEAAGYISDGVPMVENTFEVAEEPYKNDTPAADTTTTDTDQAFGACDVEEEYAADTDEQWMDERIQESLGNRITEANIGGNTSKKPISLADSSMDEILMNSDFKKYVQWIVESEDFTTSKVMSFVEQDEVKGYFLVVYWAEEKYVYSLIREDMSELSDTIANSMKNSIKIGDMRIAVSGNDDVRCAELLDYAYRAISR